jgi:hypothetical protein
MFSKQSAIIAMFALFVSCPAVSRAQDTGSSRPEGAQQRPRHSPAISSRRRTRHYARRSGVIFLTLPLPDHPRSAIEPSCPPRLHHSPAVRTKLLRLIRRMDSKRIAMRRMIARKTQLAGARRRV